MAFNLYGSDTYIEVMKAKMAENKAANNMKWGQITKMAEAAQCQRSHLSRVLGGTVHLTIEQADALSLFWQLDDSEAEFFLALVEHARAGTKSLRARVERKLQRMRRAQEELASRLKQPALEATDKAVVYYSSWYWSALHILVSIPAYQTTAALAEKLGLPLAFTQHALETLEKFALIKKEKSGWKFSSETIHLPRQSPLISLHHNNWRQRAVLAAQQPDDEGVHYTVVQSISKADYDKVKHLILTTIDQYARIAAPSKEEELVCYTCDFFKV